MVKKLHVIKYTRFYTGKKHAFNVELHALSRTILIQVGLFKWGVLLLNGFLGEKEKSTLQKCFSNILIETFKPITDFIERYGLENTARFTQILVKEMASVYEQTILFNDDFRMWLFLSQKKKYFGW